MNHSNVLIITYYWPPAGGPGVQRWLKFSQYLPEFGWKPIVYTPKNPSYPIIDETLMEEIHPEVSVLKTKIWEPYQIAERIYPKSKDYKAGHFEKKENQSLFSKFAVFIRGNFFIPDARKFWVKPSVKFLKDYLRAYPVDVIITTGPPHSMHLIGYELKKSNPKINWIADFRDPWTQISYHEELRLTSKSQKKHRELEKQVFQSADLILATSFTDAENYKNLGAKRVEVLTNGYEARDFQIGKIISSKFKITYSGGLEVARNPKVLWEALQELKTENLEFSKDLELVFWGNLSQEVKESIEKHHLGENLILKGYVSHKESIQGIKNSDVLILTNFPGVKSKGIIPGKLFEYMATGNPILAIGPEKGDVERILNQTETGKYFQHTQKEEVKSYLLQLYALWKDNALNPVNPKVHQFSRQSLTERLSHILAKFK